MRKITDFGNENVREVLLKMEPFVFSSGNEVLITGFEMFKEALDETPEEMLTTGPLWEYMCAYYDVIVKIAVHTNRKVKELDWFISITAIMSEKSEEEVLMLIDIADDLRDELSNGN